MAFTGIMHVIVILATVLRLSNLQSTTQKLLTGHVCKDEYPVIRYRCCKDYYEVGNACIVCPGGFYGNNCSDKCPDGYYGRKCLSVCSCLVSEICHPASGCLEEGTTQGVDSSDKSTESSTPGTESGNGHTYIVLASVMGPATFFVFTLGLLIRLNLRRNSREYARIFRRALPRGMGHSTAYENGGQRNNPGGQHLEENAYTDLRVSGIVPDCSMGYANVSSTPSAASFIEEKHSKVMRIMFYICVLFISCVLMLRSVMLCGRANNISMIV